MGNTREQLRIVAVGHVDHGKSTVIGRLLYDTKSLPEGAIEKVKRIAKETGKPFEYAYLLDAFEEEQKQGITIDTTSLQFHTDKRDYVIIDAPGHIEFLKNMITGAASAEAALLIIDAKEGIQEQSKRHGYILSLLGIKQVCVVVNKMDLIDYSQEKFNVIKDEMNAFLKKLNVHPMSYIPISAFYGENLTSKSEKLSWYKGETVLEALDLFTQEEGLDAKPLRFPIQDVYKFDNRRIIAGRIEAGTLKVGDEILISPSNRTTKVKSIEAFVEKDRVSTVSAGMSVGITFEDEFFNKRGEIISHIDNAPVIADLFTTNIFWMGKNSLVKGRKYKIKLVTQEVECEIVAFNKVIDASTIGTYEDATEAKTNDVAEVTIRTKEKICFDKFADNQNTGRFVIVDGYDVSGGGIISGVAESTSVIETTFSKDKFKLTINCFDEYYFDIKALAIKKELIKATQYKIGDNVPFLGSSYEYTKDFDIIALNAGLVSKIRNGKLIDVIPVENYSYELIVIINEKGFGIKLTSQNDFVSYKNEYKKVMNEKFANKWLEFTKYRTIRFSDSVDETLEYSI
ncbi:sulfate adenylyltransferase subunit 1 [Clostridium estertheticum]|uniref:sulfate adenylyltransferase n=1 Tax=Clostridium estertheticum subsp. estertheticum TaxID=1552 RepID=A0A1J0GHQ1_9CLOT|nr:GTP-binding protein [Clostridium estertheticum]APC40422.1 sulfate adenylyltransferase [Clostridium estertheticum subsp. estertheticum]MBU3075139.1 50S ribosome-binding GTPase [Clostridium estertheticum]MBU3165354.1 50S ribosome-binding GTPase [Clostridium estertheticum]MBU3173111.1 50S ribosome-binding GTPase [Clostridium estertheticum]MBU3185835.1 50S ribosome-binding GTPase [Clostridium estertheticum]